MTRRTTYLLIVLITLPVAVDALRIAFHEKTGADLGHYTRYGAIVALHVAGGLTFGALGALQVAPWFRTRHLLWHRVAGRFIALAGATAGLTALVLNHVHPPAEGAMKAIGVNVFAVIFLIARASSPATGPGCCAPTRSAWRRRHN